MDSTTEGHQHPGSEEQAQRQAVGRVGFTATINRHLPYLGPQLVVAAAIVLQFALPDQLTIGPSWLIPSLEGLLLVGLIVASPLSNVKHSPRRRRIAIGLTAIVSAANIVSLALLVHYLVLGGKENGRTLIYSGVVLWVTNVLLFGLWYWELDRGGPIERLHRTGSLPDFMFPQMTDPRYTTPDWMPGLVDYLYVSFTNATAFSPTDAMPLTPAAKSLMAVQALVSLVTVGLIVARAVNILS
jgi:uncharacterized membrane protein